MKRNQIKPKQLKEGIEAFIARFEEVRAKKGNGSCTSSHEVLGLVAEEYDELLEAVRSNKVRDVHDELMDVAICAVWGIICIRSGNIT